MRAPAYKASGFSLVELSIVLVILGLLVGGVLTGQSLIRAAELRSVSTEYARYVAATQTFRDKYFSLPGDMANATAFWGKADPTPATCATTSSASAATCDGDGNGTISNTSTSQEQFRLWQHLANAGLIEGSYTGVTGPLGTAHTVPGTNSPRPKLSNASWWVYEATISGGNYFTQTAAYRFTIFGMPGSGSSNLGPALKPEEAWNIDTKMDDGAPGRGSINAYPYTAACTNAANNTDYSASYSLTSGSAGCALMFKNGL